MAALPLEVFVLVGAQARGLRQQIRIALSAAEQLSESRASNARNPRVPIAPVHCVVYPSRTPRDLAQSIRFWNDDSLNAGEVGSGKNVCTARAALAELARTSFPKALLEDKAFLPVGVSPADL